MNFTPRPTLTGTAVTLRNPEPRDVAFRLALGFDPAIAHMFGVDPNASDTVPALLPPTEATVEQWLDAIAKHPHSWIIEHEGRLLGDLLLKANAVDRLAGRAELAISLYDPARSRTRDNPPCFLASIGSRWLTGRCLQRSRHPLLPRILLSKVVCAKLLWWPARGTTT